MTRQSRHFHAWLLAATGVPPPFGFGLDYVLFDEPIDVHRIEVGVNDSEMADISDLIVFDILLERRP